MPGRTVGNIEITVDAVTGKLKAQVVKASKIAGKAGGKEIEEGLNDVDFRELQARLKAIRIQAQEAMAGIEADIDFDDAEVRRDLERIKQRVRDTEVQLRLSPNLDDKETLADIATLKQLIEDLLKTDVQLKVNPAEARAVAEEADVLLKDIEAKVGLRVDEQDIARVNAEIEAGLSEADRSIGIGVDFDEVNEVLEAKALSAELQAAFPDIQANIDYGKDALVKAKALQESIDGIFTDIGVGIDLDEVTPVLEARAIRAAIDRELQDSLTPTQRDIGIGVDFDEVNEVLEAKALAAELQAAFPDIEAKIDFGKGALADAKALQKAVDTVFTDIGVGIDFDETNAVLGAKAVHEELQAAFTPIHVKVETDTATASRIQAFFSRLGTDSGNSFGDSAGHAISLRMRAIFAGIAVLTGPASALGFAALGDAVALSGSAFQALSGGISAAAPLFAGIVGSVGAGLIAFKELSGATKAITKELEGTALSQQLADFEISDRTARGLSTTIELTKEQRDALDEMGSAARIAAAEFDPFSSAILKAVKDLGPETRTFALELAKISPQFQDMKKAISEAVFRDMGDELKFLSATALPDLSNSLVILGGSFRNFLLEVGESAREIDFTGLAEGIAPALDDLTDAFGALIRTVGKFFTAATGPAQLLAFNIKRAAENFEDFISRVTASGELTEFLDDGLRSLSNWTDLIGSIGKALFTLFNSGASTGNSFLASLTDVVDRFDAWMKSIEGQSALKEFFATTKQLTRDLLPLLKGAQGFFKELLTDRTVNQFGELTETLGELLPFLGQIFEIIGRAGILQTVADAFALIAEALQPVIPQLDALGDAVGEGLQSALEAIAPVLPGLADAFGRLAVALAEPIADTLASMGEALAILAEILTPVVDLIADLPDFLLQIATTALLVNKALGPLNGFIKQTVSFFADLGKKAAKAGESMATTLVTGLNPASVAIVGIGAAITGAIVLFDEFHKKQREVAKRSKEIAGALDDSLKKVLEAGDAAEGSDTAWAALSDAIANTGSDVDKTSEALGILGLSTKDAADIFAALGGSASQVESAVFSLGRQMGLTAEEASLLAKNVAFDDSRADVFIQQVEDALDTEVFKSTGQDISVVADAFDTLADQAHKVDFNEVARQFLTTSAASDSVNESLLQTAESNKGINRTAENLIPLYEEYVRLLQEQGANAGAAIPPTEELTNAIRAMNSSVSEGQVIIQDVEPDWAAMAGALRDITEESLALNDPVFQAAESFQDLRDAARETAEASDALKQTWDELFSSSLNLQEATDARISGFNELQKRIEDFGKQTAETIKSEGKFDLAIQGTSESAVENRKLIRDRVEEIINEGAALTASGKSNEEVTKAILEQRQALINAIGGFDLAGQSAEDYINNLGLIPENILTSVNAAGLIEAKEGFDQMLTNIEGLPPETLVKILTPGQLEALENSEEYKKILETTPGDVATIFETPGMIEAIAGAANFKLTVEETPGAKITTIEVVGAEEGKDKIDDLIASLDLLAEKATAEVLFGLTAANLPTHASGGTVGPRGGIGAEFFQPELVTFNGRSALITSPTLLPPGAVVTPLTSNSSAAGRTVNQHIEVNTIVDDPIIVAEQIMNRTAELLAT